MCVAFNVEVIVMSLDLIQTRICWWTAYETQSWFHYRRIWTSYHLCLPCEFFYTSTVLLRGEAGGSYWYWVWNLLSIPVKLTRNILRLAFIIPSSYQLLLGLSNLFIDNLRGYTKICVLEWINWFWPRSAYLLPL